jgi:hypothetical protein
MSDSYLRSKKNYYELQRIAWRQRQSTEALLELARKVKFKEQRVGP